MDRLITNQRILFHHPSAQEGAWLRALSEALPDWELVKWQPGEAAADLAIAWAPPQQLLDEQPGLKVMFHLGAGVDALWSLRRPSQMQVVRLEDAGMAEQMVDYALYAVTRHTRDFTNYEQDWRAGSWTPRRVRPNHEWQIGIMGYGALGARVAAVLQSRGYGVHAWSRSPKHGTGVVHHHGMGGLAAFLQQVHVLIVLLPLTADTRHLLNADRLAQLPKGAYFINMARGALVDTDALTQALTSGQLAGAVLDVFEQEPLSPAHPLRQMPNVIGTPHIAAQTWIPEAVQSIAGNIRAWQDNNPLHGVVDPLRAY
jgi:glyoxylate/hydroxypyruvate reductase A